MKISIATTSIWYFCCSRIYEVEAGILDCVATVVRYYDPKYTVYSKPDMIPRKLRSNEKRNRPQVEKIRIHYMDMANE